MMKIPLETLQIVVVPAARLQVVKDPSGLASLHHFFKNNSYCEQLHFFNFREEKSISPPKSMMMDYAKKRPRTISEVTVSIKESPETTSEQDNGGADEDEENCELVKFVVCLHSDDEELEREKQLIRDYPNKKKRRHKKRRRSRSRRRSSQFTEDEWNLRRSKGSELAIDTPAHNTPTDQDEAMSHHRFERLCKMARYKNKTKSSGTTDLNIQRAAGATEAHKTMMDSIYGDPKRVDHHPHNLFVEMDELVEDEWVEQSRWIKYEEAREEGAERWGKPHVSSLSFHSLLNLRLNLEKGADFSSINNDCLKKTIRFHF